LLGELKAERRRVSAGVREKAWEIYLGDNIVPPGCAEAEVGSGRSATTTTA